MDRNHTLIGCMYVPPHKGRGHWTATREACWSPLCTTCIYVSGHHPRCWWSRTEAAAIQSGKHLKIFVMRRVQRCPSCMLGKTAPCSIWSALSQRGRTCVCFLCNTADDKIAFEKKNTRMAASRSPGWATAPDILGLRGIIFAFSAGFLVQLDWCGPLKIHHDAPLRCEAILCRIVSSFFYFILHV